jgi:hypothetical protein
MNSFIEKKFKKIEYKEYSEIHTRVQTNSDLIDNTKGSHPLVREPIHFRMNEHV